MKKRYVLTEDVTRKWKQGWATQEEYRAVAQTYSGGVRKAKALLE